MRVLLDVPEAQVIQGDSADVLPTLDTVDELVTDPPYCNGYQSNSREVLGQFEAVGGDTDPGAVAKVLGLAWERLRINRHGYVFGSLTPKDVVPDRVGATADLVWDKSAMSGGDVSLSWGVSHESIWFGVKRYPGKRSASTGSAPARLRRGTVLRVNRAGETSRIHPTQKPVELLRILIEMSSNRGELVLDPFMGSGSTGIAAVLEGRRFVGIERDEVLAEAAAARIKEVVVAVRRLEAAWR